jgi:hypothetical protein
VTDEEINQFWEWFGPIEGARFLKFFLEIWKPQLDLLARRAAGRW